MGSAEDKITLAMLKPIAVYSSIFGVVPWYSFNQHRLVNCKIFKYYSIFLGIFVTALSFYLTVMRFKEFYFNHKNVTVIESVVMELTGLSFFLLIVLGCKTHTWEDLFCRLQRIENRTVLGKNRRLTSKRCFCFFAFGNVYLIILFTIDFGSYSKDDKTPLYFISTLIFRYTQLVSMYIIVYILVLIKHDYEHINWICYEPNRISHANLLANIEVMKELYVELYDVSKVFGKLFGWPILSLHLYFVVHLLHCLSFLNGRKRTFDVKSYDYSWMRSTHLLYAAETIVWFTAIIIFCDSIANEADELLANCYRVEQMLPPSSEEIEELNKMKILIKDMKPKLSSAGFFEIRRSTLLSLLSTITTYFIVTLQFS